MERISIKRRRSGENGQSTALILIVLSVFLLGVLGFATDYAQIWAHRQMAQSAADAACQAGAADLFLNFANSAGASSDYGLDFGWIGSDFSCTSTSSDPVCKYAALNGYSTSGVSVTFPNSVDGVPPLSGSYGTIAHPYIKVTVADAVPLTFSRLLQSATSVPVKASAVCGMGPVSVPIPMVVLHKTASGALAVQGNPQISIYGGPPRSIQVDSSSSSAFSAGGSALVDLHLAGPATKGADVGVFGNEPQIAAKNLNLGAGKWVSPAFPYGDPWALISAPSAPGTPGSVIIVGYGVNGCPDQAGCVEFSAGNYSRCVDGTFNSGATGCLDLPVKSINLYTRANGTQYPTGAEVRPTSSSGNTGNFVYVAVQIGLQRSGGSPPAWSAAQAIGQSLTDGGVTWKNVGNPTANPYGTSIFDPGVYFLDSNGMHLGSGSTVRPSTSPGDGTDGTTFYFSQPCAGKNCNVLSVDANSGKPSSTIDSYAVAGNAFSTPLQCPSGPVNPAQVPATVDGNILLGPCTGTYSGLSTDGHQYRGFLFFGSRTSPENPSWGGGGQFLLSGFMYFHDSSYSSTLSLQGNSGSGAYTLGNIVTDKLTLGGTSGITMILNPASAYQILRPTLLQ